MRPAACFRHLNLGRPGSPDRAQFVTAMEAAGAHPTEAFPITRLVDDRRGGVNALLERLTRAPLTTCNWNTVLRAVERHG
jgi:hypothetical protein